jgi:signal transduction histidine kinase
MFSRVRRLSRTSGFRLALQGASISVIGAVLVFIIIFHATKSTIRSALDSTVANEQTDILARAQLNHSLTASVEISMQRSKGTFFALLGPDGKLLVGNLTITPAVANAWKGWHTLRANEGIILPPYISAIRGNETKLSNADTLYVAENATGYYVLNNLIGDVFLAVFGPILVIGVLGGLLVARSTLNRLQQITNISRDIVNGDLARRLPLNGTKDEFDSLSEVFNTMLERIQLLVENIRQVSNDIAHDLRSPLARLREHLELARRDSETIALPDVLNEAILQVDSALNLFAAMLRISEIEAGARRGSFAPIDVSTLLSDLIETLESVTEPEGKLLSSSITPHLEIYGDRELLAQMFINIIENAIRHCPDGTNVFVGAEQRKNGSIVITIADNGHGIPASERKRVLQRFVRLDTARQTPGSGLGLALVAAIADLHGYSLMLDDNEPGLKVIVDVPAPKPHEASRGAETEAERTHNRYVLGLRSSRLPLDK